MAIILDLDSANAVGSPGITAWNDTSPSLNHVIGFGSGVQVQASVFGALPGVYIADSHLLYTNITTVRTGHIVVQGGTNIAGLTTNGPLVGQNNTGSDRAFQGESRQMGALRYFAADIAAGSAAGTAEVWQNGQPTALSCLQVSPGETTIISFRLPTAKPFNSLANDFNGFHQGGRWKYGKVRYYDNAQTDAEIAATVAELATRFGVNTSLPLKDVIVDVTDSIGNGLWAGHSSNLLAKKLNGARITAGLSTLWDTSYHGYNGWQVIDQVANPTDLAKGLRPFLANRNRKIYIGSKGTNDIGSGNTFRTITQVINAIVSEIESAKTAGATHILYRTILERGKFDAQLDGAGYAGATLADRQQTQFNERRAAINVFIRAKVYPAGHPSAGLPLIDYVIDAGAPTMPYPVTLPDATTLAIGDVNYTGVDGGSGVAAGWKYYASNYGLRGDGPGPTAGFTAGTGKNDRIHPSDLGGEIIAEGYRVTVVAATTAPSVTPGPPTDLTHNLTSGVSRIAWTASTNAATGYVIERQVAGVWTVINNNYTAGLNFSDTGYTGAMPTAYRVAGRNSATVPIGEAATVPISGGGGSGAGGRIGYGY